MPLFRGTRLPLILGGRRYIDKVLSHGPIAYWPMNEPSGTVARCLANPAQNGAYTGVTLGEEGIGDGGTCPLFDGVNDFNNVFTATLQAAFNGDEGTVHIWAKVNGAGVWEDDTTRYIVYLKADGNNWIYVRRNTDDNQLRLLYRAGGVSETINVSSLTTVDWMALGLTWSATADEVRAYYNGIQTGTTKTGLGEWAESLATTLTTIGSEGTGGGSSWHGWGAHAALWDSAKSPAAMLDLATL